MNTSDQDGVNPTSNEVKAGFEMSQADLEQYFVNHDRNTRDMTSAVVDERGAVLVNEYWGVSLEIPENALPDGTQQEIYFVITDPRLCENAPPLDIENGIWLLTFSETKLEK